ncbi:MAG: DinB family protein, partial [Thermoanaerobaculia bacterium]|nr:DinB family protein [Thermoanaerobaculia bacterium]
MRDGRLPIQRLDPAAVAARLEAVRERTLALVAGLDWETLRRQHVSILSPMVWDLGHIANFEELWLGRELAGTEPLREDVDELFDAIANPRPTREALPVPVGRALLEYLDQVRRQSLDLLTRVEELDRSDLLENGFVYEMLAEHEEQHQETLLQALQLLDGSPYAPGQRRRLPAARFVARDMVVIPGGRFLMGAASDAFVYDNERRRHEVELDDFLIDRTPVTNSDFLVFVEEGGYGRRDLWSAEGWAWREETGAEAPG